MIGNWSSFGANEREASYHRRNGSYWWSAHQQLLSPPSPYTYHHHHHSPQSSSYYHLHSPSSQICHYHQTYTKSDSSPKFKIPSFRGVFDKREFYDWLEIVDEYFENTSVDPMKQALLVAFQFRGYVIYWWENLQKQRELQGKKKIKSWVKMKEKLKENFIPTAYRAKLYTHPNLMMAPCGSSDVYISTTGKHPVRKASSTHERLSLSSEDDRTHPRLKPFSPSRLAERDGELQHGGQLIPHICNSCPSQHCCGASDEVIHLSSQPFLSCDVPPPSKLQATLPSSCGVGSNQRQHGVNGSEMLTSGGANMCAPPSRSTLELQNSIELTLEQNRPNNIPLAQKKLEPALSFEEEFGPNQDLQPSKSNGQNQLQSMQIDTIQISMFSNESGTHQILNSIKQIDPIFHQNPLPTPKDEIQSEPTSQVVEEIGPTGTQLEKLKIECIVFEDLKVKPLFFVDQIIGILAIDLGDFKTKRASRRQWRIAWDFRAFGWTTALVLLWVWNVVSQYLVMVHLCKNRFLDGNCNKLKNKKIGAFCILKKLDDNAYKVDPPADMNISNTFNVADIFEYFLPDEFSLHSQNSRTSFLHEEGIDAAHRD